MPSINANNWFVAPDVKGGDGSRENPFHDPWLALHAAGPGDVIHIAAGTYYGRYDRSSWIIECPQLTLRGGYSRDFSARTPWQTPSIFAVLSGYEAVRENNLLTAHGEHSGLVLDGLFFDSAGRNGYAAKPVEGIRSYPNMEGEIASFNGADVTIRNCVFANSANGGVELGGDGSRFENNVIINIIGNSLLSLRSAAGNGERPITVMNNAFCFAHDVGPPCGTGGDQAIGVRINRPAVIQDNVFVSCGNAAIALYRDLDRVSIDGNLFYVTPRDVVNSRMQGNDGDIREDNIDELEDLGFKSAAGNVVQDPGMTGFRPEWLDAYSRHLLANYVKPPREAANALRVANGLPAITPADLEKEESKGDFAPRLVPVDVLALRFTARQGYHPAELTAEIASQPPRAVITYRPTDWSAIDAPDAALANQRVELLAGMGFEQNTYLLADTDPSTHMGIRIYRPSSDDGSIFVLARRYTLPNRQFDEAIKYTNGREAENFYLLRGVYRTDVSPNSWQKVTLMVESIVPAPAPEAKPAARPEGRDWFVRAGASGGDGSREKPFRDPFQALEKAEGGDSVHVAAGDYFGKLHCGRWKILVRNLALLGGYNPDFTERDPWKNPTRFLLTPEERAKGIPDGTVLNSEELSDGLILDGFIFDGATYNAYSAGGALDVKSSPVSPLVTLRATRDPITVRNCLFVNACGAAIGIDAACGIFENNVLLNTSGWALSLRAEAAGPWTVRNNTLLFASDPTDRAATGKSSSDGTLFHLTGRAFISVESNIFALADNFGVRVTVPQQNLAFDGNVFAANLFNHLSDTQYLWADSSNWDRRAVADSAFCRFTRNTLELPRLPVDPAFADAALKRLFDLPSRISKDDWKIFAQRIGASVTPVAEDARTISAPAATAASAASGAGTTKPRSSLDDLLSRIKSMEAETKPAAAAASAPLYCPVFDWKKALDLAQQAPGVEPGAHRQKLTVSFGSARPQVVRDYAPVTAQEIDGDHALLDNKPVDLTVAEARNSSNNPSLFPDGTGSDNYDAYSVTAPGEETRTRLALIVKQDTTASKMLNRAGPMDKLRIRGIARTTGNPHALSIVVDSAELAQS